VYINFRKDDDAIKRIKEELVGRCLLKLFILVLLLLMMDRGNLQRGNKALSGRTQP
jgi:hypothetical protein